MVAPEGARGRVFNGKSRLSRLILRAKSRMESVASHDQIYDFEYYAHYTEEMIASSVGIVGTISDCSNRKMSSILVAAMAKFSPVSARSASRRAEQTFPKPRSPNVALWACKLRRLISKQPDVDWRADLAMSLEVAEHLPA